jgi:hypothetical protein
MEGTSGKYIFWRRNLMEIYFWGGNSFPGEGIEGHIFLGREPHETLKGVQRNTFSGKECHRNIFPGKEYQVPFPSAHKLILRSTIANE